MPRTEEEKKKTAGRGRAGRQLNLRVSKGELDAWRQLAEADGLALSAWVRLACNEAARRGMRFGGNHPLPEVDGD